MLHHWETYPYIAGRFTGMMPAGILFILFIYLELAGHFLLKAILAANWPLDCFYKRSTPLTTFLGSPIPLGNLRLQHGVPNGEPETEADASAS